MIGKPSLCLLLSSPYPSNFSMIVNIKINRPLNQKLLINIVPDSLLFHSCWLTCHNVCLGKETVAVTVTRLDQP